MILSRRAAVLQAPPRAIAARTERKIALCGSHSASLVDAPWTDPSWEFWGHASSRAWYARQMDRYFDLHPRACWSRGGKKGGAYPRWLASNTVPIYMQERHPEVPASIKYPKGRILLEFPDAYFTNHAAWMIALALTEGVTTIGLFGVNYGAESEYATQRGSAEYWLGRAHGLGIKTVLPRQCTLLREPALLYGYESHDEQTGILKDAYRRKAWKPEETIRPVVPGERIAVAQPPEHLRAVIEAEEKANPRPDWTLRPIPEPPTMPDGEVLVPVEGQTVRGDGFTVRLVATNPNGPTVVPDDTLTMWRGTPTPDPPVIVAQEPSRSFGGPFNGGAQTPMEVK